MAVKVRHAPRGRHYALAMSSRSYRLEANEGTAEGVRRIALGRVAAARDRLEEAAGGELAPAIHGARKDLKKLRAVVRLVRTELGEELFREENRRYRDAGRLLSRSRDAEVKLQTLAALRQRFGEDLLGDVTASWRGALERERDQIADTARGDTSARIAEALEAIEAARDPIRGWPLEADGWKLIGPGLTKSYRQGRQAMKRVRSDPSAENVHRWRKRAKDLWYQLRIVQEARPALLEETAGQVHELADLIGDHHDLAVLAEDLASRRDVREKEALGGLLEQRERELLDGALELGNRLYAEKPKAFDRRLKRYWLAWRGD